MPQPQPEPARAHGARILSDPLRRLHAGIMGETLVPCEDAAQALDHLAAGGVVHVGDLLLEGLVDDDVLYYDPELGGGQRFAREELAERMRGVASYRVCPGT